MFTFVQKIICIIWNLNYHQAHDGLLHWTGTIKDSSKYRIRIYNTYWWCSTTKCFSVSSVWLRLFCGFPGFVLEEKVCNIFKHVKNSIYVCSRSNNEEFQLFNKTFLLYICWNKATCYDIAQIWHHLRFFLPSLGYWRMELKI